MKGNIAYNQRAAYAGFEKSKVTDRIAYVLVRDRYFKTCEPIVFEFDFEILNNQKPHLTEETDGAAN